MLNTRHHVSDVTSKGVYNHRSSSSDSTVVRSCLIVYLFLFVLRSIPQKTECIRCFAAEVAKVDFLTVLTRCLAYTGKQTNSQRNNRFNHLVLIYVLSLE